MTVSGDGLRPGTRIDEFEVVRELGSGGFGITYLARDHALGRQVCVKEFFPRDWGTRNADGTIGPRSSTASSDYAWGLKRFVEEARVLARLHHRGIVAVHRIMKAGGTAYMAMEYVEGRSLAEELEASGPLPEERVIAILRGLGEGLAEVHAAGLLHRDIKPGNVMLRERDGSPVLIDFGAARQQMGQQSRSITTVLTPGYAPIEQYASKGRQGPWTDVYALGAVAYAALSGRAPDDAPDRMLQDELPPIERVAAFPMSAATKAIVGAALQMDAAQRPQDMGEFVRMAGSGEVRAEPPRAEPGHHRDWVKEQNGFGDGPDGLGVEPEDGPLSVPQAPSERGADSGATARSKRVGRKPLWVGGGVVAAAGAALVLILALSNRSEENSAVAPPDPHSPVAVEPDPDSLAAVAEEALGLDLAEGRLVQRGLLEAGFDPGEEDGIIGGGTREALRRWQGERGLAMTGYLTTNVADLLATAGLEAFRADTAAVVAARLEEERRLEEAADAAEAARLEDERRAALQRPGEGRRFRDCTGCPEMVVVPAGSFMMGSPSSEEGRFENEGPRHRVTISRPFAAGVYEVTFAEWDACVAAGGCGGYRPADAGWGRGRRPVTNVDFGDANAYVSWLRRETGEDYRLLSEAEWEYVARARTSTPYWWGDDLGSNRANCDGCGSQWDDRQTAPVGSFSANRWGLHDVHGNVWEWVEDCWHNDYSGAPSEGSAWTSGGDCSLRMLRGGSWSYGPRDLRSANRGWLQAGDRYSVIGFRVARTIH